MIKFTQNDSLKPYIGINTKKAVINCFEKDFCPLMDNAVFGKFMKKEKT